MPPPTRRIDEPFRLRATPDATPDLGDYRAPDPITAARAGYDSANTYAGRSYEDEFGDPVFGDVAGKTYLIAAMLGYAPA